MNNSEIIFQSSYSQSREYLFLKRLMMVIFMMFYPGMMNSSPLYNDGNHFTEPDIHTGLNSDAGKMDPAFYKSGINVFKAGFARVNITPSLPVIMSGYSGRPGPFKGVNDSLFAVATVFDDGINKGVIIAADLIGFSHDSWDELSKLIEKEVFSEIGMKIKELSPYKNTQVITHCNGASGYLITSSAYPLGGYEVSATRVMSGADEAILHNVIEMLNEI